MKPFRGSWGIWHPQTQSRRSGCFIWGHFSIGCTPEVPRWAWRRGTLQVNITQECRCSFSPWTDLAFLRAGVPLEQVSWHVVGTTDASSTGWDATCNRQSGSAWGLLSAKTAILTVLTFIKRVGDLQAFSLSEECLVFGPAYSHVVLRPRPGYVPKVPTTPFCNQVVNLQALPSEEPWHCCVP